MKTQFDKIYVISLVTNHDRQEFIKYQMNELGLDFEFVYGIDINNLTYDAVNLPITYPYTYDDKTNNTATNYGCAMTHYLAVSQAYEFGYNSILILEDDACFIKDKNLVEYYLNNIPNNADFINFDPRFISDDEHNSFINKLKNNNDNYLKFSNDYKYLSGAVIYSLMNRNTMKLYLDNQRKMLHTSDRVLGIWKEPIINRYICSKCLCTDQFNISYNFDINTHVSYINIYNKINKLNIEDFYKPEKYHVFCREYT